MVKCLEKRCSCRRPADEQYDPTHVYLKNNNFQWPTCSVAEWMTKKVAGMSNSGAFNAAIVMKAIFEGLALGFNEHFLLNRFSRSFLPVSVPSVMESDRFSREINNSYDYFPRTQHSLWVELIITRGIQSRHLQMFHQAKQKNKKETANSKRIRTLGAA